MKDYLFLFTVLVILAASGSLHATNVDLGTIEQPINLVTRSEPSSIPLGQVIVETNYNYGIHTVITAPRPCRHGKMTWKGGSELDQNLASVFGISVEPEDSTNVPYSPVMIRIRSWKNPAYSPYSKEQVLAATMHCLLRSVHAGKKHPLIIKIKAENPTDMTWAKKYARAYVTHGSKDEKGFKPTPVPGTRLEADAYGVTHVVFTKQDTEPRLTHPDMMIASRLSGSDGISNHCPLVPVWVGNTCGSPILTAVTQCGLYHDLFNASTSIRPDANILAVPDRYYRISKHQTGKSTEVSMDISDLDERDLSAALHGIVLSVKPTSTNPLTITIRPNSGKLDHLEAFTTSKGWKKIKFGGGIALECEFVFDARTGKLTKGTLPLVKLTRDKRGHYLTKDIPGQHK